MSTPLLDRLKIVELPTEDEFRRYILPDKWEEFHARFALTENSDMVKTDRLIHCIRECVSNVFGVEAASVLSDHRGTRNESDAKKVAAFIIYKSGISLQGIPNKTTIYKSTVNYRVRVFYDQYETNPIFNKRANLVFSMLFERGYLPIKAIQ